MTRPTEELLFVPDAPAVVLARMDLLAEAADSTRTRFETRRQTFELALVAGPVWVDADPVRLTQVVTNLLLNATRYTGAGGTVRLTLENRWERDGRPLALIRVSDTGIGIAPEQIAQVFEPFAQLGGQDGQACGALGLGLTISRQLVELHGGQIRCQSAGLGRGTQFTVELPLADP